MDKTNNGLSLEQVRKLRAEYGPNELPSPKEHKIRIWLKQFWGPLPWLLEIIAIISYYSGDRVEALIIILLLIANGFISLYQRSKTDKALSQLRQSLQTKTRVFRDSKWVEILTTELVPGDLVRLRSGDIVSADMHLIEGQISVDQSSITGESLPVDLDSKGTIFSGSILVKGEATAQVDLIGTKTKFGTTAQLLETAHAPTHMEKLIFTIIKYQFGFNVGLILIAVLYVTLTHGNLSAAVALIIVLLVTSVPIAFPTMFAVSQTYGASQLAKLNNNKGILVRRLAAVQDCAMMNVLCTDKTGTLTKNSLSISKLITYQGYTEDDLLQLGAACSNLSDQDPIDREIFKKCKERKLSLIEQQEFVPFDPLLKKTQATIIWKNKKQIILKGLPEKLISIKNNRKFNVSDDLKNLNQKGYRTIAVSIGSSLEDQIIVGLISFEDPIREDSRELLSKLQDHGIEIKMITGDNIETAKNVAQQLGLTVRACNTEDLKTNPSLVLSHNVFADAYPEDKILIIKELQKKGYTVGMTGDGVNDSPALHQAEVGIAVSTATDVAKNSASYILVNPGLKDILIAVSISREVYQRIRTWGLNKIIKSFEIAGLSVIGYLITRNILLSPLLAVLLLFANDFVTISISTDNSVAEKSPANWNLYKLIFSAVSLSLVLLIILGLSLILAVKLLHFNNLELSTLAFLLLIYQGQASLYSLRSYPHFWSIRPSRTLVIATIVVGIVILSMSLFGFIVQQIPLSSLSFIIIVPIISLLSTDLLKKYLPVSDRS